MTHQNPDLDQPPGRASGNRVLAADALMVGCVLLLVIFFLGKALWPDRVLLPLDIVTQEWPPWQQPGQPDNAHNPLLSDVVNYIYPVKQFAAEMIRQGTFPLWNTYGLAGYPFTYNTQAGIFYPLSLLYYLLPTTSAVDAMIITQMGLGALFMLLYLRELGLRRMAALAGTILFLFNGLMVVWLEWQVVHAAIIWLPLQLYFAERLVRRVGEQEKGILSAAVGAAVALAIPWLGGHWNWTLYTSMTTVVYLIARLAPLARVRNRQGEEKEGPSFGQRHLSLPGFKSTGFAAWLGIGLIFGLVIGLGLALSLVQVLPALVYLAQSHRQDLPFAESLHLGLLNRAVVLLIPRFFGDPINRNWWGVDNFNETTLYLGILPWLLVVAAVRLRWRSWQTRFWTIWGGVGLLLALGTPVYGLLYVLPIFGGLQPSRAAILVVVAVSILAAVGLDALLDPAHKTSGWGRPLAGALTVMVVILAGYSLYYRADVARTWAYLQPQFAFFFLWALGAVSLLLAFRRGWLSRQWLGFLALVWLTADLLVFGYAYNPISPVESLYPATETTAFLQADPELFRLVTSATGAAYPPNTTLALRLPNLSGYEPGILKRLVNYVSLAEGEDPVHFERKLQPLKAIGSPLLDALNVKYYVTIDEQWGNSTAVSGQPEVAGLKPLPIEQPFTMPDAGLHRLDIFLETSQPVEARILSADGKYEFAHAEAAGNGWTSFYFEVFPSEWGRDFRLHLAGNNQAGMTADDQLAFVAYYQTRPQLAHEAGKTRVYLQENYYPRAYAVPEAVVVPDEAAALAALQDHAGELNQLVILEPAPQAQPPMLEAPSNGPATITIQQATLNQVRLVAQMESAGYVVLADSYYPGWLARLDGQPTTIFRANSVMRAVYVPAGQHIVDFVFSPLDFRLGAAVSGLTWLACLAAMILYSWRRRR